MGSPYLSSDETILLSTHNIVINTIPAEAILTGKRLILVDSSHPQFRPQDIPFTAIETVIIGENSGNNPVLSLTVVTKGDTRQTLGVVFAQPPKTKRTGERDSWAAKLKGTQRDLAGRSWRTTHGSGTALDPGVPLC